MNKYLKLGFLTLLLLSGNGIAPVFAVNLSVALEEQNEVTSPVERIKLSLETQKEEAEDYIRYLLQKKANPELEKNPDSQSQKNSVDEDRQILANTWDTFNVLSQVLKIKDLKVENHYLTDNQEKIICMLHDGKFERILEVEYEKQVRGQHKDILFNINVVLLRNTLDNLKVQYELQIADAGLEALTKSLIKIYYNSSEETVDFIDESNQQIITGIPIKILYKIQNNSDIFLDVPNGLRIIMPEQDMFSSSQIITIGVVAAVLVGFSALGAGVYYIDNTRHSEVKQKLENQEPQEVEDIQIENQEIII
jgi:hypothetical protein